MSKDEIKALIDSQSQALKDAVDSLPSGDQQAEIDQLKADLEQKKSENEALVAQVSDLQGKLDADEGKIEKAKEDLA